jgi:hypothetical protein
MRSSGEGVSPAPARPSEWAIQARACFGPSPRSVRSERVTAPWRLARRRPSGPSTSGTWAYRGSGKPSSRASRIWRGVEPEGPEVGELCLFSARTNQRAVEVLHAYQKSRPGRACEQPRQESCPQVPEVERASGTRRETSVGDVLLAVPSLLVGGDYGIQTRTGDSVGREARTTFLTPRRQSSRVMTEASDILRPGSTPVIRAAVLALRGTLAREPLDTAKAKALGVMLWP